MLYDAHGRPIRSTVAPRNAQLSKKVVFWRHIRTGKLVMGCPENWPSPRGFEKIVANTAKEAEKWSQLMREQERSEDALTDEEREQIEGAMRAEVRRELNARIANSPNELTRDFCRYALRKMDEAESRNRMSRESFLHAEGFEAGH